MIPLEESLLRYFGHSQFRSPQKEIVLAILDQKNVVAVLPTGAGKSLCYQLPAVLLPHTTIVLSPLLSLMQDQVLSLQRKGIAAEAWNSTTSTDQQSQIQRRLLAGTLKLLYLSPEKFSHPQVQQILKSTKIATLCVDEAHCIDQWGHDFRPEYLNMASQVHVLQRQHQCGIAALTATAPPRTVQLIQERFLQHSGLQYCLPYWRGNLRYSVFQPRSEQEKRIMLLAFVRWWQTQQQGSFLIYAATRLETEWYARWLTVQGFPATAFHAGLDRDVKSTLVQRFLHKAPTLFVTTSAFGMGIDKPDVRYVIHMSPPLSVEAYAQESGRAGRDGKLAQCVLLFRSDDLDRNYSFATSPVLPDQKERVRKNAAKMYSYATTRKCLSRFLLRYFWLPQMRWPEDTTCFCSGCFPYLPWNPQYQKQLPF